MQRHIPIASLLLLVPVVAACGDGGDPSRPAIMLVDAELGGVVESEDGRLRLQIPPGALEHDTHITISQVPPSEWPEDIAELEPVADVYDLQPEGLQFSTPAKLVHMLEHVDPTEFPALFGISRSAGGELSLLGNPTTHYDVGAGTATFTADLHHFSSYSSSPLSKWRWNGEAETPHFEPDVRAEGLELWLEDDTGLQVVGQGWSVEVELTNRGEPLFAKQNTAYGSGILHATPLLDEGPVFTQGSLGSVWWECLVAGRGDATYAFFARRATLGELVGVLVTKEYECVVAEEASSGPIDEGETTGDMTAGESTGGTGGETGDETTGGETTSGETTSSSGTAGSDGAGDAATGGAEPWHECLALPPERCTPCCERVSEDGEQFEQCIIACG
jgi:hypothetical protein